jgi:two-component system nitrate/nitrite response regulator NarL
MKTNQPIHVFVVAPVMLCWGFEKLVDTACPGIRMSGSAPSLAQGLVVARQSLVDILVVDHDEGYGAEALAQAAESFPVLLLTSGEPLATLEQVRDTGVAAAVRKSDAASVLVHAIRCILERRPQGATPLQGPWCDSTIAYPGGAEARGPQDPDLARIATLTSRERQLIQVLMRHFEDSGKVIAGHVGISEHTLRNHLTSIYTKLGLHSRLGLHAYAAKHHLDRHGQAHDMPPTGIGPPLIP